jgi:hypothetical protein
MNKNIKYPLLAILLAICMSSVAQNKHFNKLFDYSEAEINGGVTFNAAHNSFIVVGLSYNPTNRYSQMYLEEVDSVGLSMSHRIIDNDTAVYYFNSFINKIEKWYIVSFTLYDAVHSKSSNIIMVLDSTLAIIKRDSFSVQVTGNEGLYKILPDMYGGYFGIGYAQDTCVTCPAQGLFVKFDSSMTLDHFFLFGSGTSQFYDGTQLLNGNYILAGKSYPQAWVLCIDSGGNTLWNHLFPTTYKGYSTFAMPVDSNLVLVSGIDQRNHWNFDTRMHMTVFQYNGSILRDTFYTYDTSFKPMYVNNGWPLKDGSFIAHCPDRDGTDFTNFCKFDKEGRMIWAQRYYDSTRSDNYLWDAEQLPDGGFILAGQSFHIGHSQDGWVLRTDSNGCAPPICYMPEDTMHVGIIHVNQSGLKFWPNPVSDVLHVSWDENEFNSFSIINAQGQTMIAIERPINAYLSVNVGNLAEGCYLLSANRKDGTNIICRFMVMR